ncbi:MAG: hypothetical protein Ct9H90mP27_0200 [Gammaproteobacteria bacterium]|nr:MAG: hypothetical protein Ct9H90mP27_0200 [Gammaproteobacteria bacterium]
MRLQGLRPILCYPLLKCLRGPAGVSVEMRDISLAGRIIAAFPERLNENQRIEDELAALGELTKGSLQT